MTHRKGKFSCLVEVDGQEDRRFNLCDGSLEQHEAEAEYQAGELPVGGKVSVQYGSEFGGRRVISVFKHEETGVVQY